MPAPQYVPRPRIRETKPNNVHQVDVLYLPHRPSNIHIKYCLCSVAAIKYLPIIVLIAIIAIYAFNRDI